MSSSSTSTCQICNQAEFKYSCPKCNILYCSVACYKSPSHLQCSEKFYRKCVEDEMAANCSSFDPNTVNEGIRRMHEILQRVNNLDDPNPYDFDMMDTEFEKYMEDENDEENESIDSDDEDDADLSKRLQGVNIDDPNAVWNRLTSAERNEFESLLDTGEITKLLPPFQLWWEIQEERKLIEDMSSTSSNTNGHDHQEITFSYPEILGDIQPFTTLTQKQPSSCIIHNITNVLAAYAYMVRYFCGDHRQTPQESVNCLVTLSAALKSNANYCNDEFALKSVIYEGQIEGLGISDDEYEIIKEDVRKLYEGRYKGKNENVYILSALSDIHRLLTVAKLTKSLKTNAKVESDNNYSDTGCTSKNGNDGISSDGGAGGDGPDSFKQKFSNVIKRASLFNELDRRKLNQLIKKIEYYLSFINCNKLQ